MKKIIAFGASNSSTSINKTFATWVAGKIENTEIEVIDLNDFEMPMYAPDLESKEGIPDHTTKFKEKLDTADAFVISMAEYNGNYAPVFKNTQDWLSRIDRNIWGNKPVFLLATSPGKMGALSSLNIAKASFPHMGAKIITTFSLPEFYNNFSYENGINKHKLEEAFLKELNTFIKALN